MLFRTDRAELARPKTVTTFEGVVATVHDENDPLVYKWGKEFRRADVLTSIAAQLPGKPVTLLHPTEHYNHGGNAKSVGTIVSARVDGNHVIASFEVSDEDALNEIKNGTQDLSLGYDAECDDTGHQTTVVVDHLALVPVGRCNSCELRADKACTCASEKTCHNSCMENDTQELQKKLDEALALVTKTESERDAAIVRADAAVERADAADTAKISFETLAHNARKDADKAIADAVVAAESATAELEKVRADAVEAAKAAVIATKAEIKVRSALESTANAVLGAVDKDGAVIDRTAMTDTQIKLAVIKHVDNDDIDADKPELFINGVFESAVKRNLKGANALAETRQVIETVRKDVAEAVIVETSSERAADAALRQRYSNAWKIPSTKEN